MIQEKDFLYRVPVKTAPITTPGGQIRNPEILVDVEGGEFMHGNILDANSTNKLINQSVKEAVDNKLIESGYVTKDLLDAETTRATEQENNLKTLIGAETSARTKGDEDLSSKIKAEQTRAEGKEKEISDKLAIVNGDSNTEGSFRKAIADVVAAAPEDLDTLKEIADKLAGNDDLHTALNQAITEKADASALLNEVTRATGAENGLQAAIATKADAAALSNYVLTTALNQQVDTLNAAISAKQDAGNYIPYDPSVAYSYSIDKHFAVKIDDANTADFGPISCISLKSGDQDTLAVNYSGISLKSGDYTFSVNPGGIKQVGSYKFDVNNSDGIKWSTTDDTSYSKMDAYGLYIKMGGDSYTKCGSATGLDIKGYGPYNGTQTTLNPDQLLMKKSDDRQVTLNPDQLLMKSGGSQVMLKPDRIFVQKEEGGDLVFDYNTRYLQIGSNSSNVQIGPLVASTGGAGVVINYGSSIATSLQSGRLILTTNSSTTYYRGNEIRNSSCVISFNESSIRGFEIEIPGTGKTISSTIRDIYSTKQDKITPTTELDLTSIDTADIESLRSIVKSLATELNTLGLIKLKSAEETA